MLRLGLTRPTLVVLALLAGLVVGCDSGDATGSGALPVSSPAPGAMHVVATTTVLADLVRQVGGSRVDVTSLVPPGGEVHTFDPTPAAIARVADADLIVMNGLGLDEWVARLAQDSGASAPIVAVGEDLDGVTYLAGSEDGAEPAAAAADGPVNPHLWLNAAYAIAYVERIGDELASIDPAHRADFEAGTAAYVDRLEELDASIRDRIAAIPEDRRKVVSFHEAFPYFASAYGLQIVGTVVDAPGQDPSAGEIAALIDAIHDSGAVAVFSEVQFNPDLARTIADEAGVRVESELYNDSLGDPPADTYEGMMRWDVDRIVETLEP